MTGKLYITEYNNYGDVSVSTMLEPSTKVQEIAIGDISDSLDNNTRAVCLWADTPCRFHFLAQGEEPLVRDSTPIAVEYEISRAVHMGSGLRIATFDL
jgi:hypothetical protein